MEHDLAEVHKRLAQAHRRIRSALTWARRMNRVWRTFNAYGGRQAIADSEASQAAAVYERATLDAQIMMVTRTFDRPGRRGIMVQNRMSFPVCRELLEIPGALPYVLEQTEHWKGADERATALHRLPAFLERLNALETESPNRLDLVRGFRDENIAHELSYAVLPPRPQYDHIHGLIEQASLLSEDLAKVIGEDDRAWDDHGLSGSTKWLWDVVASKKS